MKAETLYSQLYEDAEKKLRREFYGFGHILDDVIQEGMIGFFTALTMCDRSNSKKAFVFAYQKAKWAALDFLRKEKRHTHSVEALTSKFCHVGLEEKHDECLFEHQVIKCITEKPPVHREILSELIFGVPLKTTVGSATETRVRSRFVKEMLEMAS